MAIDETSPQPSAISSPLKQTFTTRGYLEFQQALKACQIGDEIHVRKGRLVTRMIVAPDCTLQLLKPDA